MAKAGKTVREQFVNFWLYQIQMVLVEMSRDPDYQVVVESPSSLRQAFLGFRKMAHLDKEIHFVERYVLHEHQQRKFRHEPEGKLIDLIIDEPELRQEVISSLTRIPKIDVTVKYRDERRISVAVVLREHLKKIELLEVRRNAPSSLSGNDPAPAGEERIGEIDIGDIRAFRAVMQSVFDDVRL